MKNNLSHKLSETTQIYLRTLVSSLVQWYVKTKMYTTCDN